MGSAFITSDKKTIKGFMNKDMKVPFYVQFVPGYVVEVVHSKKSLRYAGRNTINTIIALPHFADADYKTRGTAGEKYRYYPLLRATYDVPSKGDPVLLCTIAGINYYLGPLSSNTNNPTWNDDPNYTGELPLLTMGPVNERGLKGESLAFNKKTYWKRLEKTKKNALDYNPTAINETIGDFVIEGRHGNSIRLGSRNLDPYFMISNKRYPLNEFESLGDGTLISITSKGTLSQHFENFVTDVDKNGSQSETIIKNIGFQLSSDSIESPQRPISNIVSMINPGQNVESLIYGYDSNQTLLHSDRITINTKTDDIYLSSIKDIHIGTGRHLTISTNENLIIDTDATFLGRPVVNNESRKMQGMVLGDELQDVLTELVDLIVGAKAISLLGSNPLVIDPAAVTQLKNSIKNILSNNHFIEPNN